MKLDHLTENEIECYVNWNLADENGGDCDGIGYAWAAFDGFGTKDNEAIILTENDYGFVDAETYEFAQFQQYRDRVALLQEADSDYYADTRT